MKRRLFPKVDIYLRSCVFQKVVPFAALSEFYLVNQIFKLHISDLLQRLSDSSKWNNFIT